MKQFLWAWVSLVGAAVIVPACTESGGDTTSSSTSSTSSTTASSSSGGAVPPDAMCQVLTILQEQCWSCHGTTLHGKAPNRLVTLADLKAPSTLNPAVSNATRAATRMEMASNPMPPGKELTASPGQVELFKAWIAAGYPAASCGDGAKDPYAAPVKCSGEQLGLNQQEGEDMHPGRACNACHEQVNIEQGGDSPLYALAGTIFPTAHEPDDCRTPAALGATVEITDSKGKVITVTANEAGNFFYKDFDLVFPYQAKVLFEGRERAMALPQMNGACNECHTEAGTQDAPGRILLP
jgi:hypothetical protein